MASEIGMASRMYYTDGFETKTFARAVTDGWISSSFYKFAGNGYNAETTALDVWAGYWLFVQQSGLTLVFQR